MFILKIFAISWIISGIITAIVILRDGYINDGLSIEDFLYSLLIVLIGYIGFVFIINEYLVNLDEFLNKIIIKKKVK